MPIVQADLTAHGPLIDVMVGVSIPFAKRLLRANQPRPADVRVRALLDTGSDGVVIDHDVVARLGLLPTGSTSIVTASTSGLPHVGETYDVSAWIYGMPPRLLTSTTEAFASNLSPFAYHIILGRSILDRGCLVYDGRSHSCSFDYDMQSP